MPFASPNGDRRFPVRQRRQGEARVREPDALLFLAQYTIGGFHQCTLVFGQRLPTRLVDALLEDQVVHLSHGEGNVRTKMYSRQLGLWWRGLFEGILIRLFVCATIVQWITWSRATKVHATRH